MHYPKEIKKKGRKREQNTDWVKKILCIKCNFSICTLAGNGINNSINTRWSVWIKIQDSICATLSQSALLLIWPRSLKSPDFGYSFIWIIFQDYLCSWTSWKREIIHYGFCATVTFLHVHNRIAFHLLQNGPGVSHLQYTTVLAGSSCPSESTCDF